jgi:peptidoglycan-N-acetylglucosamine deacetylase
MVNKWIKLLLVFVFTIAVLKNPFTAEYMETIKKVSIPVTMQETSLKTEIELQAKNYEIAATDAKIDRVWKAMPGYNGLKVDIEQSYQNMKKLGTFDPEKLIFQQIPPKVHLKDLPPSPIYRGHPDKPMVSFIVNVAWGNEYLPSMLETLKKNNVHVSFFLEGKWTQKNPELAKMIVAAGHEIGNHSFSHPDMKILSSPRTRDEIVQTNKVIKATTGLEPKWFGPPSGSYRDDTVQIAAESGMGTIMWSVDTIDWQKPTVDILINRVMKKIHNGALILMHPTESTAKSLDQLIKQIKQQNLQIGTVSQVLDEKRIVKNNLIIGEDKP